MPQLFVPQDCSALLPVGNVTQRNVFWRITAIDADIDFAQLVDAGKPAAAQPHGGITRARLGIPLAMWAPAWQQILSVNAAQTIDGARVSVGAEGLFLPGAARAAARSAPSSAGSGVASLPVDDLEALESGALRAPDGRTVVATAAVSEQLLRAGQAYAGLRRRNDGGTQPVLLQLREYRAEVTAPTMVLSQALQIRVDGAVEDVELTSAQRLALVQGRIVRVRAGRRAVRLTIGAPDMAGDGIAVAQPSSTAAPPKDLSAAIKDWLSGFKPIRPRLPAYTEPVRPLPRIEIVLATPIVQRWQLLGYERGPLIGSVLLEPGTEASIEVFTWERLRLEREEQVGGAFERNTEVTALARSTATVAADTATELGTRFDFGGDASIPLDAVSGANLGITGSTDTQTAVNTNVSTGRDRVAESTRKSAERFQATHQVKIVQTTERGQETRSTRKLRNPNAGRTLEFLHFAIHERHQVTTAIEGPARVVACIENPSLGPFDIDFVFAHEHVLKRALLSGDYVSGFAAARVLAAQASFEDTLRVRAAREAARRRAQELARRRAEEAAAGTSPEAAPGIPKTGIYQTARQIRELLKEFIDIDLGAEAQVLADNINPAVDDEDKPSRARVKKADARFSRWGFWAKFTMAYPGMDDKAAEFVSLKFDGAGHATEEEVVAALQTLTDGLDDDWVAGLKMIAVATIAGTAASIIGGPVSGILQPILIALLLVSDDMGLPKAITRARQELLSERAVQHGEALATDLAAEGEDAAAAGAPAGSAGAPAAAPPPPPQIVTDLELAEARADFRKLLAHLKANTSYYQNAVWRAEDPADRFVRLETMGVAPYVENVLVGFVGNRAMYPLRVEVFSKPAQAVINKTIGGQALSPDFAKLFTPVVDELVLPTPAVHCEAYLGSCELLEPYLVDRRNADLAERRARAAREAAVARQEEFEAKRFEARLLQNPPMLDDPTPANTLPAALRGDAADGDLVDG